MLPLVILVVVYGLCLAFFIRAKMVAPHGYEDDRGFHFGAEPDRDEYIDRPLIQTDPSPSELPAPIQKQR
jgi:hypothetical protein